MSPGNTPLAPQPEGDPSRRFIDSVPNSRPYSPYRLAAMGAAALLASIAIGGGEAPPANSAMIGTGGNPDPGLFPGHRASISRSSPDYLAKLGVVNTASSRDEGNPKATAAKNKVYRRTTMPPFNTEPENKRAEVPAVPGSEYTYHHPLINGSWVRYYNDPETIRVYAEFGSPTPAEALSELTDNMKKYVNNNSIGPQRYTFPIGGRAITLFSKVYDIEGVSNTPQGWEYVWDSEELATAQFYVRLLKKGRDEKWHPIGPIQTFTNNDCVQEPLGFTPDGFLNESENVGLTFPVKSPLSLSDYKTSRYKLRTSVVSTTVPPYAGQIVFASSPVLKTSWNTIVGPKPKQRHQNSRR